VILAPTLAFTGFEHAVLSFIDTYGYAALFVLLALETAMILHFVPSEIIIAVTAARLVHSPLSLAMVTLDAAAASTVGSLMLYAAARYGGRDFLLRHPRLFHITREKLARLHSTFEGRAGPALVFVCRLLPFLRAFVSIPAGLAKMDLARFTAYSFVGNALFALAIAWVSYSAGAAGWIDSLHAWALDNWPFLLLLTLIALAVTGWLWWRRHDITRRPRHLVMDAWTHAALLLVGTGVILVAFAAVAPGFAARIVTAISDDYAAWATGRGLSSVVLVLILGLEALGVGFAALALGRGLRHWLHRQG